MAVVYAQEPAQVARALDLLPPDTGANVVLTLPYDPTALART
jgi:hypothetical protein